MSEPSTAFAIKGQGGMWLTAYPATFGHDPHHPPILFTDVRKAEAARRNIPIEPRGYTSIVVIEWRELETIGHTVGEPA